LEPLASAEDAKEAESRWARLVVSHRRFQLQERLEQLQPGALVDGTIDSIRPYGAIVTLAEGLDGLLHISQVSKKYVRDVNDVLSPGTKIRGVVIKVDMSDGTVNLSTKMLESVPGEMIKGSAAVFERAMALDAIKVADPAEAAAGSALESS